MGMLKSKDYKTPFLISLKDEILSKGRRSSSTVGASGLLSWKRHYEIEVLLTHAATVLTYVDKIKITRTQRINT